MLRFSNSNWGFQLTVSLVNELSNTIDLPSTILRAEALFRRFQRTVEAVDKKHNFPAPTLRQRRPTTPKGSEEPTSPTQSTNDEGHSSEAFGGRRGGFGSASHQRQASSGGRPPSAFGAATGAGPAATGMALARAQARGIKEDEKRVISPELRALLSREVVILDGKEIREHGGGVGT